MNESTSDKRPVTTHRISVCMATHNGEPFIRRPLIAPHFNLPVELPLKAIVRGFSWTVIPCHVEKSPEINGAFGEHTSTPLPPPAGDMGYLFICLYIWLEL